MVVKFPLFDTLDEEEEPPSPPHLSAAPTSSSSPSTSLPLPALMNPSKGKTATTTTIATTAGEGINNIQYLPGDIKGLQTKLNYLLAEYRAGNRLSTRNEIVPILDELLRRRKISRKEYKDINTFLHQ